MTTANTIKQYRFVGGPKVFRTEVKAFTPEQAARQIKKATNLEWSVNAIIERLQVRQTDTDPWVPVGQNILGRRYY